MYFYGFRFTLDIEKISNGSVSRSKVIFCKLGLLLEPSGFRLPVFNKGVGDAAKKMKGEGKS